jgi:hypothetical protein
VGAGLPALAALLLPLVALLGRALRWADRVAEQGIHLFRHRAFAEALDAACLAKAPER